MIRNFRVSRNWLIFSADDYTIGSMNSRAMLFYDGIVFWPPPTQLRSTCKTDVTYFPFDSQHCAIKFGSWTYDGIGKFNAFILVSNSLLLNNFRISQVVAAVVIPLNIKFMCDNL